VQSKGFTLIELLLVIVIVALAVAVAAPTIGSGSKGATLNAAARDIRSALRFVRGHALTQHKETQFLFNLDKNSYQLTGKNKTYMLSKEIEVTLDIAQSQIKGQTGAVRFFPDGSSTGGRITLELAGNKRELDINWLTGQIELNET